MVSNSLFGAATWLVVVILFSAASPASGQAGKPTTAGEQEKTGGRVQLDGRWVDFEEDIEDEEEIEEEDPSWVGFDSLFLGGGGRGVTHAGQERAFNSQFGFGGYSIRNQGWEVIKKSLWLQLGLNVTAEGSLYESRYFRGDTQRYMAGLEFTLIDMERRDEDEKIVLSLWSLTGRLTFGFDHETGRSRTGDNYVMNHQDTSLVRLNGQLEIYAFFSQTALRHSRNGLAVRTGFLPTVALLFDVVQPLHSNRSSNARHQGFRDPPAKKDRQSVTLRVVGYRGAWRQGLYDIGVDVGGSFYRAAGYESKADGRHVGAIYTGLYTRLQLAADVFVYATVGYEQETATERGAVLAMFSLELIGFASGVEDYWRGEEDLD